MPKFLPFFAFSSLVLCCIGCCPKYDREVSPLATVTVKFDTTQPGGFQFKDIDTVLVKYTKEFHDSMGNAFYKPAIDTFLYQPDGSFKYQNFTLFYLTLGLNKEGKDSALVVTGTKQFLFHNMHQQVEYYGRCDRKSRITRRDVMINNDTYNLTQNGTTINNISYKDGFFYLK